MQDADWRGGWGIGEHPCWGFDANHAAMLHSLETKVLTLDDDTVVLPGHGATTTIGRERATNPYLTSLAAIDLPTRGL